MLSKHVIFFAQVGRYRENDETDISAVLRRNQAWNVIRGARLKGALPDTDIMLARRRWLG